MVTIRGGCEGKRIQGAGDGPREKFQERSTETCERLRRMFLHGAGDSNGVIQAG